LRRKIKAKLRAGASREKISWLISTYAPPGQSAVRTDGAAPRLAVELIPHRQRTAFLAALSELPKRRPASRQSLASWMTMGMKATGESLHSADVDHPHSPLEGPPTDQ
jgi:hypothetical protein